MFGLSKKFLLSVLMLAQLGIFGSWLVVDCQKDTVVRERLNEFGVHHLDFPAEMYKQPTERVLALANDLWQIQQTCLELSGANDDDIVGWIKHVFYRGKLNKYKRQQWYYLKNKWPELRMGEYHGPESFDRLYGCLPDYFAPYWILWIQYPVQYSFSPFGY